VIRALLAILCLVLARPAAGEAPTTVRLLPSARVADGAERLTVAEVALVTGPQAGQIGAIAVWTAADGALPEQIGVDRVRTAAREACRADRSLSWALLRIEGAACALVAQNPTPTAPPPEPTPAPSDSDGPTIRDHIEAHLSALFSAGPDDLRLTFRDDDAALLATPVAGRLCEVRLTGSSGRMPVSVTLYNADRIELSATLRVGVELRRRVAVLTAGVERGRVLDASVLTQETRWVGPDDAVVDPAQAAGLIARTRLRAGEAVTDQSVELPLAAKRGQIVSVRSIVGGAVIKTRARALAAARDGELVELETLDRSRRFVARMSGPGRAVVARAGDADDRPPAPAADAMGPADDFSHISIGEPA
jgi:flagella basal body P-ring formation protein FlgA